MLSHRRSPQSMRFFYNWFCRFYPMIEKSIDPILGEVADRWIAPLPRARERTAIEYACGSGSFSLVLGRHFRAVEGRDASEGMLERARRRAQGAHLPLVFRRGDILQVEEKEDSFDYVFVSFALHLFGAEQVAAILRRLLAVARESVLIVDHPRKWSLGTALAEWIEGSCYDTFIRLDFQEIAKEIGARTFQEWDTVKATVLVFSKHP